MKTHISWGQPLNCAIFFRNWGLLPPQTNILVTSMQITMVICKLITNLRIIFKYYTSNISLAFQRCYKLFFQHNFCMLIYIWLLSYGHCHYTHRRPCYRRITSAPKKCFNGLYRTAEYFSYNTVSVCLYMTCLIWNAGKPMDHPKSWVRPLSRNNPNTGCFN